MHWRDRKGNETKNLNVVDLLTVCNKYSNLKLAKATIGRELGSSEEGW
jgi:hypothetical protein